MVKVIHHTHFYIYSAVNTVSLPYPLKDALNRQNLKGIVAYREKKKLWINQQIRGTNYRIGYYQLCSEAFQPYWDWGTKTQSVLMRYRGVAHGGTEEGSS